MNENVNMNQDGTGLQMTSTIDSVGNMGDSSVSQNNAYAIIPTENMPEKSDSSLYGQWINVGIFIIVFALLYFIYKQMNTLKWRIQETVKKIIEQNNIIVRQNKIIDTLRNRLDKIELNADTKSTSRAQEYIPKVRKEKGHDSKVSTVIESANPEPTLQSTHVIRYATLQAPDANGILRFAERSMSEVVTDQKMFEIELDTATGTGEYRINQSAKSLLLGDLQQLRDFVEPFTTNGNTPAQRIIDVKPGKIHQDGKFWIVDELAIIKIV